MIMPKVRRITRPSPTFRGFIETKPKDFLILLKCTYWDLIGRLFSGESSLDTLLGTGYDGGHVIQIFQEKSGDKDNTHFLINAYDSSDELSYFVRIHRDDETDGVFLTYLGTPPWN